MNFNLIVMLYTDWVVDIRSGIRIFSSLITVFQSSKIHALNKFNKLAVLGWLRHYICLLQY